ncbi:MAG: hypothetical protein ACLRVU_01075 [Beduini sp.]|uniref:hypothetical protein n=1 Tax=Beduini sp. TaxID=1922300 RepID=UPI0039A3EE2C
MNSKNIKKVLRKKLNDWISCIEDKDIAKVIKKNAIITGGAIVSLLNGEPANDFDVYFKTKEACEAVAKYYAAQWNDSHKQGPKVEVLDGEKQFVDGKIELVNNGRITCFIRSAGIAIEEGESAIDDDSEPVEAMDDQFVEETISEEKPKYRPRYFSTNAISLSDKIQLVIRFYGSVEEIHENYDFVHCTCSYDFKNDAINLPNEALECILNKELRYIGSKYPLCSIIRTRKFISRGWHINAGQYVKMALQLDDLNLKDFNTFKDQLVGVDSAYFANAIEQIEKKKENEPDFELDNTYLFTVINRIF